jgi:NADH:ubiquinone oxidoreductase subunit 6 (subunit J)
MSFFLLSCIFHSALLAVCVSWTRSPFMALMFAVMLYINTSLILLFLGFEFFALINMLVYVGALAVLFLFVIMLLEIPSEELRAYNRGWSALALFGILGITKGFYGNMGANTFTIAGFVPAMESLNAVGHYFYIMNADLLILNSLVLTVALFGALVLAHTR